jgi:hypothetical protein
MDWRGGLEWWIGEAGVGWGGLAWLGMGWDGLDCDGGWVWEDGEELPLRGLRERSARGRVWNGDGEDTDVNRLAWRESSLSFLRAT